MDDTYLRVEHLSKSYPGVRALDDASVSFQISEVHALLGENGAGKSTLCKILSGAITPDGGKIVIGNQEYTSFTPQSAKTAGIGMVYQELTLVRTLTVYENFFLGKEIRNGLLVDKKAMVEETRKALDRFHIDIDPEIQVRQLSIAYQQMIEICKTVYENAKILILDEPTAPLTSSEVEILFELIREMKKQGIVIIYISHRMEELYLLSEKVTVMRDGCVIGTYNTQETTNEQLVALMVGRELGANFPAKHPVKEDPILVVEHLTSEKVKDISFTLNRGEVLGFGGLVGAGRTETAKAIFGADEKLSGKIIYKGKEITIKTPKDAIDAGIGYISEDRKGEGLLLKNTIIENISLLVMKQISRLSIVDREKQKQLACKYQQELKIKTPGIDQIMNNLSGGNQQKVIIGKWLASNPDVLILDEPTRGIDVATKYEIYELIDSLRKAGKGIILISSELPELIGMSDRIMVMYEGSKSGELKGDEITQVQILTLASGIK